MISMIIIIKSIFVLISHSGLFYIVETFKILEYINI